MYSIALRLLRRQNDQFFTATLSEVATGCGAASLFYSSRSARTPLTRGVTSEGCHGAMAPGIGLAPPPSSARYASASNCTPKASIDISELKKVNKNTESAKAASLSRNQRGDGVPESVVSRKTNSKLRQLFWSFQGVFFQFF